MTEEEMKAVNNLWSSVTDVMFNVLYSQEDLQKDLKIALNLIQKQQKEIEKKDKIIDRMAEYIDFDKMNFNCSSLCVKENCQEECTKQYFENEVEGE